MRTVAGDTDDVSFNVTHVDGDGANDVKGIAKATGEKVFFGDWVSFRMGAGENSEFVGGAFEEPDLLDESRVAHVNDASERWAGLVEGIGEAGSLVGGVGLSETVEVGVGRCLLGEVAEGRDWWWLRGSVGGGGGRHGR